MGVNSVKIALLKGRASRPSGAEVDPSLGLLARRVGVALRGVGPLGEGKRIAADRTIGGPPLEAVERGVLLVEGVLFTVIQM